MKEKKANGKALLPILVFLVLYLGTGIWYEYIRPVEGQERVGEIARMISGSSVTAEAMAAAQVLLNEAN